jgi:hypothetical protein
VISLFHLLGLIPGEGSAPVGALSVSDTNPEEDSDDWCFSR